MQHLVLDSYNLESAERRLCVEALTTAGNIVGAARLLGITRHALKRRILKLDIPWSRGVGRILDAQPGVTTAVTARAA
jgi:transcriptional regulator with GAF, ATPase, and Fis domain